MHNQIALPKVWSPMVMMIEISSETAGMLRYPQTFKPGLHLQDSAVLSGLNLTLTL